MPPKIGFNGDIRHPAKAIMFGQAWTLCGSACVDVDKVEAVFIKGYAARVKERAKYKDGKRLVGRIRRLRKGRLKGDVEFVVGTVFV
jgi:hypothetical protein